MKKFLCIVMCVVLVFVFSSCSTSKDSYTNSNDESYDEGYYEGYESGEKYTQRDITIIYEEHIRTQKTKDAITILKHFTENNYSQDISEDELRESILDILEYYNSVEDYFSYLKTKDLFDVMDIYYQ